MFGKEKILIKKPPSFHLKQILERNIRAVLVILFEKCLHKIS